MLTLPLKALIERQKICKSCKLQQFELDRIATTPWQTQNWNDWLFQSLESQLASLVRINSFSYSWLASQWISLLWLKLFKMYFVDYFHWLSFIFFIIRFIGWNKCIWLFELTKNTTHYHEVGKRCAIEAIKDL